MMINLLPPQEKEQLLLEKRRRLLMVLGNVLLIFLVFLTLVLFSVKFYILGQAVYQTQILTTLENQYQTPDFLFYKDLIEKHNYSLVLADQFYKKETSVSDAVKMISGIEKPAGLYLTNVTIEKGKDNAIMASVSGISNNRDSLINFKSKIEEQKNIKNIYFPATNWIKPADFPFYVTFEYIYVKN